MGGLTYIVFNSLKHFMGMANVIFLSDYKSVNYSPPAAISQYTGKGFSSSVSKYKEIEVLYTGYSMGVVHVDGQFNNLEFWSLGTEACCHVIIINSLDKKFFSSYMSLNSSSR